MVGDKPDDIAFARNIGATAVLVLTGQGRASRRRLPELGLAADHTAADVLAAARWILRREKGSR